MRILGKRRQHQQAKEADKLEPKRHCSGKRGLTSPLSWTPNTTGEKRVPNPFVSSSRNMVSLYVS